MKFSLRNGQVIEAPNTVGNVLPTDFSSYYGVSPYSVVKQKRETVRDRFGGESLAPTRNSSSPFMLRSSPLGQWMSYDPNTFEDTYASLKATDQFQREVQAARDTRTNNTASQIEASFAPFSDDFFGQQRTNAMREGANALNAQYRDFLRGHQGMERPMSEAVNDAYWGAFGGLNGQADTGVNELKNQVVGQKQQFLGQNETMNGDPTVATNAAAAATNMKGRSLPMSPLGDVFRTVMGGGRNV